MSRHGSEKDLFGFRRVGDVVSKVAPKHPDRV